MLAQKKIKKNDQADIADEDRKAAMGKSHSPDPAIFPLKPSALFWGRVLAKIKTPHRSWQRYAVAILAIATVISGIATYAALKQAPPLGNDPDTIIWLLNIDFVILLMFIALVASQIVGLWSGRKRGIAGSHLHVRLVYTFGLLAAAPAIIMTIFSAVFFHFGVQAWFSERVSTAVNESQAVAEAYLEEHKQAIRADTLAMANDLDRQASVLIGNELAFDKVVQTQSFVRNLSEALIFDTSGRILARSGLTFTLEYETIPQYAMSQAEDGDVVIMTGNNDDRVRALVKLSNFVETYLLVGRLVDPQVLSHLASTREASKDYADLQARNSDLQIKVTMIFVFVGLVLLLTAMWFGLNLARQLVMPIGALITTADRVRAGDLAARAPEQQKLQEFDYLAQAFNRMTRQIQEQQSELIKANRQLDRRRRFTETVLSGVSSGVLGVDIQGTINLANASALQLLDVEEGDLVGYSINKKMPEIQELLEQAHSKPQRTAQGEISISGDTRKRIFLVRIAVELVGDKDVGAIVTFDDITELQSAQRKAAWADVARRIAHEIKNPLTPIQLSAERLKRKYLKQITDDPDTFAQCTETIVKNVEDIGRMVSEFSSFARMPEPVMEEDNLAAHVEDSIFLHKQAHPDIKFEIVHSGEGPYRASFDAQQIRQALNNLIQNAIDSIHSVEKPENPGRINILISNMGKEYIAVAVSDNGPGFPKDEKPENLTEPYITHKPRGTGLGLAIVKKIIEDHNGSIILGDTQKLAGISGYEDLGGATVALVFPRSENNKEN